MENRDRYAEEKREVAPRNGEDKVIPREIISISPLNPWFSHEFEALKGMYTA